MLLVIMLSITIDPPKIAYLPGASPANTNTHIGFSNGSIIGINMASTADTCLTALTYNI